MQIIPAIDVIDGQCVRLTKGDYAAMKVYYRNPVDAAKLFEGAGLVRLHLVDLDGAKAGMVKNLRVLEAIATQTRLQVDFSGGIKSGEWLRDVFNAGAAFAAVGSVAVKDRPMLAEWLEQYGAERFMVGADVLDGQLKIGGWLEATALRLDDFVADMLQLGIRQIFCTDIAKDGAMAGPSVSLYRHLLQTFSGIQLIASGGVTTLQDVAALKAIGCSGAIIGKAIYEKTILLEELVKFND